MNKKIIAGASAGAIILIIALVFGLNLIDSKPLRENTGLGFTYDYANSQLKTVLASQDVLMSSPLKISGDSIEKYCKFFDDASKQSLIQYCTSTELKDSDGKFLGNIHIVGSKESPELVIGIIQTDPFMSQYGNIKKVFSSIIQELVCDCWSEYKPDNFASTSLWFDAMNDFHKSSGKITTKSKLLFIEGKYLQLEVTTNKDGYLWKLFVTK